MESKTIFITSELLYFVAMLICWVIIWWFSGLDVLSLKGMIFFVAIVALMFIVRIKESLDKYITNKYKNKK